MTVRLLPPTFDEDVAEAVRAFWTGRRAPTGGLQGGGRDAVIGGKSMDAFIELVRSVGVACGLPASAVHGQKGSVTLPGYFRATKSWDALVIHQRRLLAVFEFKSQVGSFGNNFNNRAEEVIGAAADLWVAHHRGAFAADPEGPMLAREPEPLLHPELQRDPRPPFLAWMMLLEECPRSLSPVGVSEPHCRVLPEFRGASYAARYQLLCERLVERRLYGAAALVLSSREEGATTGGFRCLSEATSLRSLFAEVAGRAAAAAS